MGKSTLIVILSLIIFTFLFSGMSKRKILHYEKLNNRQFHHIVKQHFPDKQHSIYETNLGRFAVVFADTIENYVLTTADYSKIKGYQGYSNLEIVINAKEKVERIELLSSDDSEPYVEFILKTDILSILSNQHLFMKERSVYIVTGATITSEVFSKSVSQTLDTFRKIYEEIQWKENKIYYPDSLDLQEIENSSKN